MGEVWRATDTLLNRPVAIKYLKATNDTRIKELFLSEAQTLARLNHPNITQIHDAVYDEAKNRFYLVMEYVDGEPLEEIINGWDGPLPLEIILDMIIGLVEALDYAHNQGIVHRDIKPANVMIRKDGAKLTDFGIAGLISILSQGTDFVIGTPAYISPEQIEGGSVDGRADLYALGIMLYEMVSGQGRPFHYSTQTKLFMAHLQESPPNIKDIRPDLPLALERTIMRLLEKEPENRFASSADLLETLQSIQARLRFSQPHLQFLDPEAKPFVNRQNELEQIQDVWDEVNERAMPRLMVVQGPMGIGKTRLITEFIAQDVIDERLVALAGRCDETGVPYAPFAEILGTILNRNLTKTTLPKDKLDDLLRQIPSLSRILNITDVPPPPDEVMTQLSSKPTTTTSTSGLWQRLTERVPAASQTTDDFSETQWQFSTIVLDILTELDDTALFLEDAAYLDEASAKLVRFLLRQGQLPLLIIAACRDDEEATAWLADFAPDEVTTITLPVLETAAIETHLANLLDGPVSEEVVSLVEERSRGNPLHIEETTRQLAEIEEIQKDKQGVWQRVGQERLADAFLPESVLGAFTRRIEKLSAPSQEALALAALLEPGPEFDLKLWQTFLQSEGFEHPAADIVAEAEKRRLLRSLAEQRYSFRPPDVSQALAATLTGSRRKELHQKMADFLRGKGVDPLLVAYHYEKAGMSQKASQYLQLAGANAASGKATNAALTYYHRAATLVESRFSYKAIGDLQRQQGNHDEAVAAYRQTLSLAKDAGDAKTEAEALNNMSLTLALSNRYEEALDRAEAVLKLESISETERAIAKSHLGLSLWLKGQLAEAETWCQQALQALPQSRHEEDMAEAHYRLGLIHTSQGKFNQARIAFQQSLKLQRSLKNKTGEALCLSGLGRLVAERGDFDQALALFNSAEHIFEENSSQDGLVEINTHRGRVLIYQQQPAKALVALTKALDMAHTIGEQQTHILGRLQRLMSQAHLDRGKIEMAKPLVDEALNLVEAAGNREQMAMSQSILARIYARQNDSSAARIMYREALALFETMGHRPGLVRTKLHYAQFLAQQQPDQAAAIEQEARDEAKQLELFVA